MKKTILIGAITIALLMLLPTMTFAQIAQVEPKAITTVTQVEDNSDTQVTTTIEVYKVPTAEPTVVYFASFTQDYIWFGHLCWTRGSGYFTFSNGICTSITETSTYGVYLLGWLLGYRTYQFIHTKQVGGSTGQIYAKGIFRIIGATYHPYSWVKIIMHSNGAYDITSGYGDIY